MNRSPRFLLFVQPRNNDNEDIGVIGIGTVPSYVIAGDVHDHGRGG
jgi:hypothetical protein